MEPRTLSLSFLVLSLTLAACTAQDRTNSFTAPGDVAGWQVSGPASFDDTRSHGDGGGSLAVGPKATALWKLREADGAGKVSFWVYEDGTQRKDEKTRGAGPMFGIQCADGRVLVAGALYAPYLAGNTTYALSEYKPAAKEVPFTKVTYLGVKRTVGWHQWTFDFNPDTGLKITVDKTDLAKRFKWDQSDVVGFVGVVAIGDLGPADPQTAWLDDVSVSLIDGALTKPEPVAAPAAAASGVPATDPPADGPVPTFTAALKDQHPRLLFDKTDVAALKAFAQTPTGQIFWKQITAYLGASKPPAQPTFLRDATDGQRQGMWRMPTVALHYALTGDQGSFDSALGYLKMLLALDHWETGQETDSGMSSANICIGAALAYDMLYNELDPAFREQFRQKLWEMARRQYYLGHLMRQPGTHYWQGDPQNNHRWHRNAGMSLCLLAAYTGDPSQDWMMQKLGEEMKYVADWLPADGTSHESPGYMIFGASHLMVGMQAMDRCLGTSYLTQPFFANVGTFMLQTLTPGLQQRFHYGDQGGTGVGGYDYDVFEMKAIGANQRGDLLPLVDARLKSDGVGAQIAWLGFLWYPRDLRARPAADTPTQAFFSDVGVQFVRDTWDAGGRGAMFKCGPYGGYLLNKFSHANGNKYVNVAHDDPDANSFILFKDNEFVAESDRYSAAKKSANLNTILVNGLGQINRGRTEGAQWSQPGGDMSMGAVITARDEQGASLGIEGEASGNYIANPKQGQRPALDRYRRSFLWVDGRYLLVLDDIRSPQPVDIDWLLQSGTVTAGQGGRFVLQKGEATCPLMIAVTEQVTPSVVDSPADNKNKPLGWKQLRLRANTQAIRFASVYDLWGKGNLTITLQADGPDHAVVKVTGGGGINDTWDWTAGTGKFGPSTIVGNDGTGQSLLTLDTPEAETAALLQAIRDAGKQG